MQKAQDADGPQGSFESIRQSDPYSLDSLGPLLHIMRIQAKDDSYEKTRQSMANAMAQNGKTCVKELKPNVIMNRHRPTRPSSMVVPPHKKEPSNFSSNPYSSHNGNTTSSSPHRSSSGKQSWNVSQQKNSQISKKNEALKKRPLRERIIQLLALRPMNKLQLLGRIRAEGVKECDNRHISSVLQSIATVKNNAFHLPRHLWSEVNDNWSFYSEDEKAFVQKTKPQNLSPNEPNNPAPLSPCSLGGASDTVKRRPQDPLTDLSAKRSRTAMDSRVPELSSRSERDLTGSSGIFGDESPRGDSGLRDTRKAHWPTNKDEKRLESSYGDSGSINGHISPSATSVSPLSQNNSPRNPSFSSRPNDTSTILSNGFGNRGENYRNVNKNNHSDKNHSNNNYYENNNTGDLNHIQSSSPTSSPDSQQENKDQNEKLNRKYSEIKNSEQRRQYKSDFNRIYKEYKILHADLEKTKIFFKELESSLNTQTYGSPEYHKIKASDL
ncbi:RNA polymerase II elongation factor Ell [Armadillidium nasatum]|uniref:RNA polymerase II elongation factor Ell n=1 Tax=Armadillidium nasatum TaxID=96803 RepID=A0A5N5THM8_9CRUS|nr:RNA polymerase II elongation factor Ell [Armadillidium nasatum]